jgi:hypothetical protein
MNICIIGGGAYGCYAIDAILAKYPSAKITLLDVGNEKIKSEEEIGYFSSIKERMYTGLSHGRFFGFGGTTEKWGGQLLTYTKNDFENPNDFLSDLVILNEKFKSSMLSKFGIQNNFDEKFVHNRLFTKTGVWLSVFKRNFFKHFRIIRREQVSIISNARVISIVSVNRQICKINYLKSGIKQSLTCDFYFLTVGAFETARLLLTSGLIQSEKVYFSDHLSQKTFKIQKSTQIGQDDFAFKMKGFSLITKRLVGEFKNCSFYVHPVFNMGFPFFQSLKEILFKKQFSLNSFLNILRYLPQAISFTWTVLVRRRIFVYKKEWYLYIDIDNPTKESYVRLSDKLDKFGERGLDVIYNIGQNAPEIYNLAKEDVIKYLNKNKIVYELLNEKIDVQNIEDIYHPHNMFGFANMDEYFNAFSNMLFINTGILPRSGGINPTASLFPIIDEFVNYHLKNRIESNS